MFNDIPRWNVLDIWLHYFSVSFNSMGVLDFNYMMSKKEAPITYFSLKICSLRFAVIV